MRAVLLGLAASLAALPLAAPANAQAAAGDPPTAAPPGPFDQWAAIPTLHRNVPFSHRDGGKHRRFPGTVVVGGGFWGSPEAWALYNNRTFAPESFNDWWHERPWRAYPRWMQSNQNCDRMWWGGGVWRCSW